MDRFICLALLFLFGFIANIKFSFCYVELNAGCIDTEKTALLSFKKGLDDPSNRLFSWDLNGEKDCYRWIGVLFIIPIMNLGGKISPSLLELKQLKYLDLSGNYFGGNQIPEFVGSLKSLKYLNLSDAGFGMMIPRQLGNLSRLSYLDLSRNDLGGTIPHQFSNLTKLIQLDLGGYNNGLEVDNLQWLSRLSSLNYLDMSLVNLAMATDWLQVINMLPSLLDFHLSHRELSNIPILHLVNFTSLSNLDLSNNNFNSLRRIPNWLLSLQGLVSLDLRYNSIQDPFLDSLWNMSSLRILRLSRNQFQGMISDAIGNLTSLTDLDMSGNQLEGWKRRTWENLCNLKQLDLSHNNFKGEILGLLINSSQCFMDSLVSLDLESNQLSGHLPNEVGNFKNLKFLSLRTNSLSGPIPKSLGHLSNLEELHVSQNSLKGVVSEIHFANLTSLKILDASSNSLDLKVNSNWDPPFRLQIIFLRSWKIGPKFPMWLQTQKGLEALDLSDTGISEVLPTWFWNLSSHISYLNISCNQIIGEIPGLVKMESFCPIIFLRSNRFSGPLPSFSSNVTALDLSNNYFSGSISHFLCRKVEGSVNKLEYLNLSGNTLSGGIPNCWMNWPLLVLINLGNNNLTGNIPRSIGSLTQLLSLYLRNNNLFGEIPSSLRNCTSLNVLDLGENELFGRIPQGMGLDLSDLWVLDLRSNRFNGSIPLELCQLVSLQILDLADNNLSGTIPHCFGDFSVMAEKHDTIDISYYYSSFYYSDFGDEVWCMLRGRKAKYSSTLRLVTSMDLSNNCLSGEIPKELTRLIGLMSLNLSRNHLTGKIPEEIGDMGKLGVLEILDFSVNNLSGVIPQGMASLTSLNFLKLLQSFNADSFMGNQGLCGPPLTKDYCIGDGIFPKPRSNDDSSRGRRDLSETECFFLSMAIGFVVGFWAVFGPILFNKSWRRSYFHFLDSIKDKCFA
uniref:Uncharacterized protein n=1 Tax=Nelumbo nucifera TaxID=4432 RepID=A0A822Z366_NELNU|nr:TPA_asm: hypothetical protein HUJ06_013550 [Nelumbo nucifera]